MLKAGFDLKAHELRSSITCRLLLRLYTVYHTLILYELVGVITSFQSSIKTCILQVMYSIFQAYSRAFFRMV